MSQDKRVTRKLSAILSADVKGYSLLMAIDEIHTIETLKAYRQIISALILKHSGRVVDSPGDNILAEFRSSVDAVECAVKIQKRLEQKNSNFADDKKIQFRIGVNIGDVIQDGDNLYGEGVNIAARIEGLADARGVCISRNVYDQIKNKLTLGYEYIGEHSVKNIKDPVRVYKLLMADEDAGKLIGDVPKPAAKKWIWATAALLAILITSVVLQVYQKMTEPDFEPATVEEMAYPLSEKPSIAVLPFENLSEDPIQEYFCDGLSEGIINALAKTDYLLVIARNSTFTYKDKPTKVKQIAEDLGVRYVLEGSIQKSGGKVRITVQLIDALSGYHIFSERYDRELKDFFSLQDEITKKILTAVQVKLTTGEAVAFHEKGTDNLDAYLKVMQARDYKNTKYTKESVLKAIQLFEEAIALDPEYASAYSFLSTAHFDLVILGATDNPKESLMKAIELGNKAITLDEFNPSAHANLVYPYVMVKKFDKAFEAAEKAVSIAPNSTAGYFALGFLLVNTQQFQKAIPALEKCLRLSPIPVSSNVLVLLGNSYKNLGQYEDAITTFKKALHIFGNDQLLVHLWLAHSYVLIGLEEEARVSAAEIMRIDPNFTISGHLKPWPLPPEYKAQLATDLRKAGLPYEPPLPLPDKPSIAVLAFDNLSGDPEQEYLSDGISENIITALSKVSELFIIARNSSFTYKNKPVKVRQIGRELGVRYILEGSIQKSDDKVRITAQLIDAKSGQHLWAENYDRDLKDILALQDEITTKIITALQVKLTEGDQAFMMAKGTSNLKAYLKVLQANNYRRLGNVEDNVKARRLAEEAVSFDPEYAMAYSTLSRTHVMDVMLRSTKNQQKSLETAIHFARKAISLDNSLADAYDILGHILIWRKDYDEGIGLLERALELEPNGADVNAHMGLAFFLTDRPKESIQFYEKAIRLNPNPPGWYLYCLAMVYNLIEKYDKAILWSEKAVRLNPKDLMGHIVLCSTYSSVGRMEEARNEASEILKINPIFTVSRVEKTTPHKNQIYKKRYYDALRKAGLPD